MIAAILLAFLIASGGTHAFVDEGILSGAPAGYLASNLDPLLNSSYTNQIYDPNFIPGFAAGLQNVSVTWQSGDGYGRMGYQVGPWGAPSGVIPHFTVGPQCCNFVEIPRTQQYRLPAWGDYYYVRAGLGPPGVNVANFTLSSAGTPAYVGLRTDRDWVVKASFDWSPPESLGQPDSWAAVGIAATQYVANASGKLVYSLVNFYMNPQSSARLSAGADDVERAVSPPNLVTYHPLQLTSAGNQTVTIDLSWYLQDTLRALGLPASASQPPVISYVYINVEGYNFRWNSTLLSFYVLYQPGVGDAQLPVRGALVLATVTLALVAFAIASRAYLKRLGRSRAYVARTTRATAKSAPARSAYGGIGKPAPVPCDPG